MKKMLATLLALTLALSITLCAAAETSTGTAPLFMTPSVFANRFFTIMDAMADRNADSLGPEAVKIIKESYTFSQRDAQGAVLYYGNSDWSIEAGFLFADGQSVSDESPALVVNLTIRNNVPEVVASLAKFALMMIVSYDFQDQVSTDELQQWFDLANGPSDIFVLPGYSLSVIKNEEYTQYFILSPAEQIPQLNNGQP